LGRGAVSDVIIGHFAFGSVGLGLTRDESEFDVMEQGAGCTASAKPRRLEGIVENSLLHSYSDNPEFIHRRPLNPFLRQFAFIVVVFFEE